jgi:Secretion system C-terminal sorting domain/PKD domain
VATATLDGSGSYDTDGTIVKYQWVQISGGGGITIVGSSATVLVYGLQPGVYVFQLTVTDDLGATSSAQVTITVDAGSGTGPVAVPGNDTTLAYPANTVALNGGGSYDGGGGTIVAYSWTEVSGPTQATLAGTTSAILVPSQLEIGQYVFSLTVTDNKGDTASANVNVTVADNLRQSGNTMAIYPNPVLGTTVTLTGMNSWEGSVRASLYDLNGRQVVTYVFAKQGPEFQQQIALPAGLAAGAYILNVQFDGQKRPYSYKLIKQ